MNWTWKLLVWTGLIPALLYLLIEHSASVETDNQQLLLGYLVAGGLIAAVIHSRIDGDF